MSKHEFRRKSELLQKVLGDEAERCSRESQFVRRQSKVTGTGFATTVILGWLDNPKATLNELIQGSHQLGIAISESGLHQRFNDRAVVFLKSLLERSVKVLQERQRLPREVLQHFSQVNVLDSSIVTLPEALQALFAGTGRRGGAAAAKLQLSFDYLTGALNALEVVAGRTPDQRCTLHCTQGQPNSLHLFDLGYFDQRVFHDLAHAQAYFISRLQTQTALYAGADDHLPLDLLTVLQAQPVRQGELDVYMGRYARVKVRLIFERLPAGVVAERRRKAKAKARQRGRSCSKRHLALLAWSLFITNVPEAWLSPAQVVIVYRVRWQVELIFKLWKSQAKLKDVGTWKPARVLCQFYARLLGVVLFHWTVAPWRFAGLTELSLPKAFRVLQRYALRLLDAIAAGWHLVPALLEVLIEDFLRFAPKNTRKKSPSTYQRLILMDA
jgi:hypothetical protein